MHRVTGRRARFLGSEIRRVPGEYRQGRVDRFGRLGTACLGDERIQHGHEAARVQAEVVQAQADLPLVAPYRHRGQHGRRIRRIRRISVLVRFVQFGQPRTQALRRLSGITAAGVVEPDEAGVFATGQDALCRGPMAYAPQPVKARAHGAHRLRPDVEVDRLGGADHDRVPRRRTNDPGDPVRAERIGTLQWGQGKLPRGIVAGRVAEVWARLFRQCPRRGTDRCERLQRRVGEQLVDAGLDAFLPKPGADPGRGETVATQDEEVVIAGQVLHAEHVTPFRGDLAVLLSVPLAVPVRNAGPRGWPGPVRLQLRGGPLPVHLPVRGEPQPRRPDDHRRHHVVRQETGEPVSQQLRIG